MDKSCLKRCTLAGAAERYRGILTTNGGGQSIYEKKYFRQRLGKGV